MGQVEPDMTADDKIKIVSLNWIIKIIKIGKLIPANINWANVYFDKYYFVKYQIGETFITVYAMHA
jgi:hypothetical protein